MRNLNSEKEQFSDLSSRKIVDILAKYKLWSYVKFDKKKNYNIFHANYFSEQDMNVMLIAYVYFFYTIIMIIISYVTCSDKVSVLEAKNESRFFAFLGTQGPSFIRF